ncbi:plastocyanin/azurin family copper-binding protein [Paenibacillus rigui]|nr:plastocyanin/azurin family copper-binding protein [Paenibacillus rigui]
MMKKKPQAAVWMLAGSLLLSSAFPAWAAGVPAASTARTDAQIAEELGILQGDGSGVTDSYLSKTTTRLQAAILFLRLKGLESAASGYKGSDNFSDAGQVSEANKAVLSYLKANPQLGWTGTGSGKFEPGEHITAQQYYKVLLEALGYKQDNDYTYDNTLSFAESMGLSRVAKLGTLRNGNIATATVEALPVKVKGGEQSLLAVLVSQKVVDAAKASLASYTSIGIADHAQIGSYLVDGTGRTLYMFMKDSPGTSACKDQCAVNWPVFYADNLRIPAQLNAADFGAMTREDGAKQTTYKGMPMYYYIKDTKPGDTNGQGVNQLWMVFNHSGITVAEKEGIGSYLADAKGMALYMFTKDSPDKSACKGNCESAWPIFHTEHLPVTGELSTSANHFGTITREDGTKQTTFKGMPLYYYVKDQQAGDVWGQDVNHAWYVIDPKASEETPSNSQPQANAYSIEISHFAFSQTELTVEAGSTITFTNQDDVMHNAVSDALNADGSPVFETKLLGKGESASITLTQPGEYTYYCRPHQSRMKAKIIVK